MIFPYCPLRAVEGRNADRIAIAIEHRHALNGCGSGVQVIRIDGLRRQLRLHDRAGLQLQARHVRCRRALRQLAIRCLPPLYVEAGRIDEVAVRIEGKVTVTRIVRLIALLHDEEAVALQSHIRVLARGLRGTIREEEVDARHRRAETDLLWVRAADDIAVACRGRGQRLGEHVRKRRTAGFKARRVHVGDVIADDIHARLMGFQARDTRKK